MHILHFDDLNGLKRAFCEVIASDAIETCEVDTDQLRLGFSAAKRLADPLAAHLQHLTGCIRHGAEEATGETSDGARLEG